MNVEMLGDYADAWNRHDADSIMGYMTDDCVFFSGGGTEVTGSRYEGREEVRRRFEEVWKAIPDVQFVDGKHFVSSDRGLSEWTLTGTRPDGTPVEANGCDVFTFRGDKILIKDSYVKNRR